MSNSSDSVQNGVTNALHNDGGHIADPGDSFRMESAPPTPPAPEPSSISKRPFRLRLNTDGDSNPPQFQQVPLQDRKKHHFAAISVGGSLLTLNAGFINAVTVLHSGLYSSHVTGTFTRAGVSIEEGNGLQFFKYIMLIMCFIFGSFLTSLLVPYQTFYLGRAYNLVFILGTLSLLLSALFGIFIPNSILFVYFACISCGMQNAMTTGYSGSVLRTTHMTGMATDVGIIIGKFAKGDRKDMWKLAMFIPMMIGFLLGGAMGAKAVTDLGVYALLMNVVLFGGTGLFYTLYLSMKHRISFFNALTHSGDLLPRKKGQFVPKDENVDVAIAAMESGSFDELTAVYGNGNENDSETDEDQPTARGIVGRTSASGRASSSSRPSASGRPSAGGSDGMRQQAPDLESGMAGTHENGNERKTNNLEIE